MGAMGEIITGVSGAVDAAGRSFKSLQEVQEQAKREISAANAVAMEAASAVDTAQQELETTEYWLGAVQDKVDREVRQARKAAARLRKVRKKPKGASKRGAWLSHSQTDPLSVSTSVDSPPTMGETYETMTSPVFGAFNTSLSSPSPPGSAGSDRSHMITSPPARQVHTPPGAAVLTPIMAGALGAPDGRLAPISAAEV